MIGLTKFDDLYCDELVGKDIFIFFLGNKNIRKYSDALKNDIVEHENIKELHELTGKEMYFVLPGFTIYNSGEDDSIQITTQNPNLYFSEKLQRRLLTDIYIKMLANNTKLRNRESLKNKVILINIGKNIANFDEENQFYLNECKLYKVSLKGQSPLDYYNDSSIKFVFGKDLHLTLKDILLKYPEEIGKFLRGLSDL